MKKSYIKSFAKINISLKVLKKLKSGFHSIESIISFINLYDQIFINKNNKKNHEVKFYGKFSKKITKNNTILNLLKLLDKMNKLKGQKFLIKVYKNIPTKSGLGGGSMNAASVLKYFLEKEKVKLDLKEIKYVTSEIGSDVIIGMQRKNLILQGNGEVSRIRKNFNLFALLVKPSFGCPTKKIYKLNRYLSKSNLKNRKQSEININFLIKSTNDLEKAAFKKYPALEKIKRFMNTFINVRFVRMTGSGSTIIAYFNSKKAALNAEKILKKKYKNYWCILSKTI